MANLVLYRKYRPKNFSEIVGQGPIIQTLKNAVLNESLAHAYLFCGSRGCGKTSLARILAKAINCQNRKANQAEPCNQCDSCLEIAQGKSMDLIEIDAASNRGIEEIRELKEGIRFRPVKSKYKVFIIDEVHQLTKEAANALLKTLEEPPEHAIFILATTELSKMIPTILSRCQRFGFHQIRLPEMVARLSHILDQEKIKYEKPALELIALASGGALRDAESLLDQVVSFVGQDGKIEKKEVQVILGSADLKTILQFLHFLNRKQAKEAIELINAIIYQSVDLKEFAKMAIGLLREVLFLALDFESQSPLLLSLTETELVDLKGLAVAFSPVELKRITEIIIEAENKMKYASILQLPLELAIIEICTENR